MSLEGSECCYCNGQNVVIEIVFVHSTILVHFVYPNLQQIFLGLLLERAEPLFVVGRQFAGFVFELLQLLQLGRRLEIANLIVQSQEGDGRLDRLAGFRRQTDNLERGKADKILLEQT